MTSTKNRPAAHACGTCRRLAEAGQPTEHQECARRATLLPAPDAPHYETLVDLTDEQRQALPAHFHIPVWEGNATPKSWLCAVCWGDCWVTRWPCKAAVDGGGHVFTPEHAAVEEQAQQASKVARLTAEVQRLTDELAELRAANDP